MTRIEQIRQNSAELLGRRKAGTYLPHDDVLAWQSLRALLSAWDTRDAALRTLVEQLRARSGRNAIKESARKNLLLTAGEMAAESACADALDAILKETTP